MSKRISVALLSAILLASTTRGQENAVNAPAAVADLLPLVLLRQQSVREELGLSPAQIDKAESVFQRQREALRDLNGHDQRETRRKVQDIVGQVRKALASMLQPKQLGRLRQIALQIQGARAVSNPMVAQELAISDKQKERIKRIEQTTDKQITLLIQSGAEDPRSFWRSLYELNKAGGQEIQNILSAEQQRKWQEITGTPFAGAIRFEDISR